MKKITIELSDKEYTVGAKIAALRGITVEELALDGLRLALEVNLGAHVEEILDIGIEKAAVGAGA